MIFYSTVRLPYQAVYYTYMYYIFNIQSLSSFFYWDAYQLTDNLFTFKSYLELLA